MSRLAVGAYESLLVEELSHLDTAFAEDELAFLALTSKVELPVRDRLAYRLSRRLAGKLVAREWSRVDLAVVDEQYGRPELLLEVKAMYTFDPRLLA